MLQRDFLIRTQIGRRLTAVGFLQPRAYRAVGEASGLAKSCHLNGTLFLIIGIRTAASRRQVAITVISISLRTGLGNAMRTRIRWTGTEGC